ncbi:hypothetical protein CHLRE_11g467694v5 [Chlamydomonas reinhardtii]|uniref:Uncharacterized protein n=1 Tax=Chlamydomonas reinhardtii TaxID=3055 RepID=A0A2K3D7Q4_CHLRE|nr:uncharacterized protein CHLRE_11g467694v5 [Chlamydomonas reinhardtii]PNW76560.1 hypothetical protein CHLRE_11g467694v5 [Chlamydomonas reinhardtii]
MSHGCQWIPLRNLRRGVEAGMRTGAATRRMVATPTRQQTCVTRWWRCYWVTRGLLRCAAVVAAAALAQGQEAVLAQGQAAAAAQGQAARGQAAAAARVTAPSVYLTPQASTSCPVHI